MAIGRQLRKNPGSPPPMRGKGVRRGKWQNAYRITPAYAGKSRNVLDHFRFNRDHPRLCGEKEIKSSPMSSPIGSPPPMRGKGTQILWNCFFDRITPAYAGKSSAFICSSPVNQDHPRLCGEKTYCQSGSHLCKGSPPPMRGKGLADTMNANKIRITPAYAGKRRRRIDSF